MLELSSVLALSGLLALASAQGPAADLNSVCFPSGQLKNTIPYPCPGIARAKDECNKFLPGPNASPEQLKKHRDCLCFDQKIIQFEKGCTACKKTHAFLSKRGEGYWNGILDRVYSGYCQAETPTAAYDASWASASQAAGPYPTGGPDDVLINYAKDLPADEKTKVELYWQGTTEERRPSATAAPTSVSTSAAATPTLVDDDDDDWCDDEETTSASAGSAAATTVSPNTAVSGSTQPTPVLNDDWITASAKEDPSASTVRPPQPSQSGWTKQNQTSPAPTTETVYIGRVVIVRVCQKCVYAKSDNGDFRLACSNPMEVEGTKKQVPVEEAKHLPAVPASLPKAPVAVEQKKQIIVPDTIIQQVCGCSYTSGPSPNNNGVNGSNPGSSKNPGSGSDSPKINNGPNGSPAGPGNEGANGSNGKPGSGNNGANGSNPDTSKNPGSGSDSSKINNGPNGSTGSPAGPGNKGANGSNGKPGSGNNGANGSNPETPKTPGSGPDSPKTNGSNGPNGSTGSPAGPGNEGPNGSNGKPGSGNDGANGSNGKPGSGNNGANGSNPGSPNAPGSGNTGAGSDAGSPKNPGSNGSNGPNNAGSNGVAAPSGSNPSKPTRVGSAGLPSGTNKVPIVSSASGNMPASVAMLFLAAMAILI